MSSFDDISLAYDNSIDWESRLKREMPFLLSLIERTKSPHVLDLACGSGRHSVSLANYGAEVIGIDSSKSMVQAAEIHAKEKGVTPIFIVADMESIKATVEGPFDLIICLGNSLALVNDVDTLKQVVKDVFTLLKDGGSFVAQVLNFEEIHWTGFRNFPMKTGKLSNGEEITFARLFEHSDYPFSSTLVMSAFRKQEGAWTSEVSTQKVLNLKYDKMKSILQEASFSSVDIFSDYAKGSFEKKDDRSMVIHSMK
ncbi:class I SAM-dependent methyltransferase [Candidatus Thorarchaeota archaeon]|nr:MAG: class I SAM-dependent methyltransferase [Candidatus Thorarchaeota archaeon]